MTCLQSLKARFAHAVYTVHVCNDEDDHPLLEVVDDKIKRLLDIVLLLALKVPVVLGKYPLEIWNTRPERIELDKAVFVVKHGGSHHDSR